MRPVAYNDRTLFIGKTQSGKSTLARWFWGQMVGCRRVCVNVKGSPDVGAPPVYSVAAIDWAAPIVNFVPSSMSPDLFEALYAAILEHGGPTNVWLDEAFGPTSGNRAPDSLLVVQQQGAALGIGHTVCSQRPKNIAVPLRTEAEHLFLVVPPVSFDDLGALADEVAYLDGRPCGARELGELLRDVQAEHGDHAVVWWQRHTGELVVMPPLDPGEVGAPLPQALGASQEASGGDTEADTPGEHQEPAGPELEEVADA